MYAVVSYLMIIHTAHVLKIQSQGIGDSWNWIIRFWEDSAVFCDLYNFSTGKMSCKSSEVWILI